MNAWLFLKARRERYHKDRIDSWVDGKQSINWNHKLRKEPRGNLSCYIGVTLHGPRLWVMGLSFINFIWYIWKQWGPNMFMFSLNHQTFLFHFLKNWLFNTGTKVKREKRKKANVRYTIIFFIKLLNLNLSNYVLMKMTLWYA